MLTCEFRIAPYVAWMYGASKDSALSRSNHIPQTSFANAYLESRLSSPQVSVRRPGFPTILAED
jgi:hypothetical protein